MYCFIKRSICTENDCNKCPDFEEGIGYADINNILDIVDRPGTLLKAALVKKFSSEFKVGCGCAGHVVQMNEWGVDGCIENIDTIVEWLYENGVKRNFKVMKIPFIKKLIKRFVLKSIKE